MLLKIKKKIFPSLHKKATFLQIKLNDFFVENKINTRCYRFKSMLRLVFSEKNINDRLQRDFFKKKNLINIKKFRNFLLNKGIYYPTNGIIFISTQTTKSDLDKILKLFKIGVKKFIK